MATYIAFLPEDPDSDFGVDFPDLPGCITAGSTIQEAKDFAVEALRGHIEVMTEYVDPIPPRLISKPSWPTRTTPAPCRSR